MLEKIEDESNEDEEKNEKAIHEVVSSLLSLVPWRSSFFLEKEFDEEKNEVRNIANKLKDSQERKLTRRVGRFFFSFFLSPTECSNQPRKQDCPQQHSRCAPSRRAGPVPQTG